MTEELQGLLEKIQEEGVKKADDEKERIISDAKAEAQEIVKAAKAEAASLLKQSEKDAEANEKRAAATIQQAARDIVLALRSDLEGRLKEVVKGSIGEAMTPKMMTEILKDMVKTFQDSKGKDSRVEVMLSSKDLKEMEKLFRGSLVKDLKGDPDISLGHDFSGGLKIGFKGSDVFLDFSDDAIADLICEYIGPNLAAYFDTEKSADKKKKK